MRLKLNAFAVFSFSLVLLFEVFGAPIRFLLFKGGLGSLSFIPQACCLAYVFYNSPRLFRSAPLGCLVFLIFVVLGIFNLGILQTMYGVYLFSFVAFGFLAADAIVKAFEKYKKLIPYIIVVASAGVILDYFIDYPWTDFSYEFGSATVDVGGTLSILGFDRLSGTFRTPFAAGFTLCTLAFIYLFSQRGWVKFPILAILATAVAFTTVKGAIGALLLLFVLEFFGNKTWILKSANFSLMALVILIPVYTLLGDDFSGLGNTGSYYFISGNTFQSRIDYTWPTAISLTESKGYGWFGRGIGGIGSPMNYFEQAYANPADNLFVYLYCIFGLLSLFIIFSFVRVASKSKLPTLKNKALIFYAIIFCAGISSNAIESLTTLMLLGAFYGVTRFSARHRTQSPKGLEVDEKLKCSEQII